MKEMEFSTHEELLNRLDVQTRVAVMWVQSEPRFAEEIDVLGNDKELANYALEKFVESDMAEKFDRLYGSNEIRDLALGMKNNIQTEDYEEKIKLNKALMIAVAQKIFEMISKSEVSRSSV